MKKFYKFFVAIVTVMLFMVLHPITVLADTSAEGLTDEYATLFTKTFIANMSDDEYTVNEISDFIHSAKNCMVKR